MKPRHLRKLHFLTLASAFVSPAFAASDSWKTNAAGNWNDTASWTGANIPGSTVTLNSTDVATFGFTLTAGRIVTVDANRNIGGISFSNTSGFGYTLSSGSLKLSSGGLIQSTGTTGAHTDMISSAIEIQGDGGTASFTNSSSLSTRLMNIGAVTGVSTGSNVTNLILNGANTGVNAMTGIIGDGAGTGKLSITKSDAGTWSLQNTNNSYSGGTTVNAGILQALTAGSLGTGTVNLAGGQLHLINAVNTAYNNNTVVSGNTQISATRVSGTGGSATHTLGTLSIGANTLTLAAFSGITGGLIFGDTTLTGNASFTTNASTTLTLGSISGGSFSITKGTSGATGTLVLANTNNYSGGTNINFGTLQVGNNGITGDMGSGAVSIASGTTLSFARSNAATFTNAISGAGVVRSTGANSIITLTNDSHTGSTLIQNGVLQTNNTSASNIVLGTSGSTFNYGILGLVANFTGALGTSAGNISWATGINTSGGFAVMDNATRSVNIGGNVTPDTLTLNTGGFVGGTLGSSNSRIAFGDVNGLALGTVEFKNSINLGSGDRSLIMVVNGAATFAADLTGNIIGSGLASGTGDALVKFGNGNVKLSGTNTYTGRTVVGGQGAVILNSAAAFSPNTWMSLEGGAAGTLGGILGLGYDLTADLGTAGGKVHFAASGGFAAFGGDRTVTLNSGGALTWASTTSFIANAQNLILGQAKADGKITLTNDIDLNGAARTVQVNRGTALVDGLLSGTLSGTGGIVKAGGGILALSAANTFSGDTKVTGGTLVLSNNLAIQNSSLDTSGAGNVNLTGSTTPTFGGLKGSTDLATGVSSGYSGVTALTLNPGTGASPSYSGVIADGAAGMTLTKSGVGTQTLSGANTYTGATQVNVGKLLIGTGGSLGNTAVTVGGATASGTPTLGGVGTIAGATLIAAAGGGAAGTHAPGIPTVDAGVGKQTFSSNLEYGAGSIFEWDLNGNTTDSRGVAGGFDAVDGVGTLTVDDTASTGTIFRVVLGTGVTLTDAFWNTPNITHTWSNIFSGFSGLTGGFENSNLQVTGQNVSEIGSFTITGTSLTWTAVPEPTSALAGLLLGAGLLRRKR